MICGQWVTVGLHLKECPTPSLAGLLGTPPMGTLLQDYGNTSSCALLEVNSASATAKVHEIISSDRG